MYQTFYTGDGTTTEYVFNFPYFQDKDIQVSVNSEILDSTNRNVIPAFDNRQDCMFTGGTVVLATAPDVGAEIRIWRKIDLSRTIDYQAISVLNSDELNADFKFLLEYLRDAYEWDEKLANIENSMQFLDSIQSQIETLGNFNELARKNELPDLTPYALHSEIPDTSDFALTTHTHAEYAPVNHTHNEYATNENLSALDDRVETLESAEVSLPNNYDFVTEFQEPTSANGYTWYRKYKSGWVEMGGQKSTNGANATVVNLPITMKNNAYDIFIQGQTSADGYSNATWQVMPVATTSSPKTASKFYAQASISGYNLFFYWRVTGMIATNS